MIAKSIKGDSPQQIQNKIASLKKEGFQPTLAFAFASEHQDRKKLCTVLDNENISIFDATTAGEFIDEEMEDSSIVVLLLDVDRNHFRLFFKDSGMGKDREIARQIAQEAVEAFNNPVFIVSGSGKNPDGEMIVRGIIDKCGPEVSIFGGMAGFIPGQTSRDTFVFTKGKESNFGTIVVTLDGDRITTHGMASCGWKAAGTTKTVTMSEGCWVQTIDNEPALDLITKYMGIDPQDSEEEFAPLLEISINYPMQVFREDGGFIMRSFMAANWKERSFMCASTVTEGSKIKFALPAELDVIQTVVEENEEAKKTHFPDAEAVIVFSCFSRFVSFGPLIGKEIQGIKETWNAPMAGFFTFGEFGRATGGSQEFHNLTCSWVALKEK